MARQGVVALEWTVAELDRRARITRESYQGRVVRLKAAVALAAKTFRQYQDIHIRKFLSRQVVQGDTNLTQEDQNNIAKSERNRDLAEAMERAIEATNAPEFSAQAEADATLGGMVRQMPPGSNLRHGYLEHDEAEWLLFFGGEERFVSAGETPEQALAGRKEV